MKKCIFLWPRKSALIFGGLVASLGLYRLYNSVERRAGKQVKLPVQQVKYFAGVRLLVLTQWVAVNPSL